MSRTHNRGEVQGTEVECKAREVGAEASLLGEDVQLDFLLLLDEALCVVRVELESSLEVILGQVLPRVNVIKNSPDEPQLMEISVRDRLDEEGALLEGLLILAHLNETHHDVIRELMDVERAQPHIRQVCLHRAL